MNSKSTNGPGLKHVLDGYTVLDFTHALAGPTATRLMVEMGAEVIKVEIPPVGDITWNFTDASKWARPTRNKFDLTG